MRKKNNMKKCIQKKSDCFAYKKGDCMALIDTDFGNRECVFYKTKARHKEECKRLGIGDWT